ncbi:MAG TPA: exosortase [Methylomirabilota bacterium]|jgi:exosortase|nr:exosortase [Methylomirabilota bacterium]
MTIRETILRNTFWYGVVTGLGLVAGLLMSILLARGLGPERMGDYSYLLWLFRTMTALATLGFALATTRYTAEALGQGERALAGALVRFFTRRQVIAAAVVAAGLLPVVVWTAPRDLLWPLVFVIVGLFPITLEGIYSHAAYGAQRYDLTTQASTLKMTLHLLGAIAALALGADILGLVIGGTIGTTISCALQRRRALTLYPDRSAPIPDGVRAELRGYLLPLSIVAVLDALVWDRSEVFFLRLYAPAEQIAFYSVAFGLATKGMIAAEIAAGTLLPALASIHGRGAGEEFGRVYRAALRWVALVGAPLAAVGTALAPGAITLLYGEPYRPVALLLGPMLGVALIGVMRQVAWAALRASGDRRWALNATWISAVLNIGAAALLIPRFGMWGAVVANTLAQLTASVLAFVAVTGRQGCGFPALDLGRIAAAGAMALVATRLAAAEGPNPAGLVGAAALGLAVFVAAALALGALGPREWNLLRTSAQRIPRRPVVIGLGTVAAACFVTLYAPVMRGLVDVWATVPYYSHGFVVPLFAGYGIWDARRRLAAGQPAWSPAGLALLAGGLAVLATGAAAGSLTIQALSLPAVLTGTGILLLGRRCFGAIAFPIAFLVFMAPLPQGAIPAISLPLQELAAWFAGHALAALGIPTVRDGLGIHIPGVVLHVTEACNGLRFLLAMIVVGTAFAWTTQRRAGRRAAILALAIVVAITANLIRVAGTGVLAHYYGPETAMGFFHIAYGKVVYFVMLVPFMLGVALLRRAGRLGSATDAA